MNSFWDKLKKPFTVLAPMDGVTDVVFRQIITEIGKPDVLFTEFTPCAGLLSTAKARVEESLLFNQDERPIVAQIWGHIPDQFLKTAKDLRTKGFDGIDINMGCPIRTIIRDGACSGLIKNPDLAVEIIRATKKGAGGLPVSVKTRLGYNEINIDWIKVLLRQELSALTIHLRTVAELSKAKPHWERVSEIISLRNKIAPKTLIIVNGNIRTIAEVYKKYKKYGCDGFMIGSGVFANPWVFNEKVDMEKISVIQRIDLYLHHIDLFEKQWDGKKNFAPLKKFAKIYISNFESASDLREKLMESKSIEDLKSILLSRRKY